MTAATIAALMPLTSPDPAFVVEDRGYSIHAYYLPEPNHGLAQIEIFKDGAEIRVAKHAAYAIWNLSSHFSDIVDACIDRGVPVAPPLALRSRFKDSRGRLPLMDGRPFVYLGRLSEHFAVDVWFAGFGHVPALACADEIFEKRSNQ